VYDHVERAKSIVIPLLRHVSTEPPFFEILQFLAILVSTITSEIQVVQYRTPPSSTLLVVSAGLLSCALSAAGIFGVLAMFDSVKGSPREGTIVSVVGSGGASLFFAAGFIPQIITILKRKSSEGYSMGITVLQVAGSALAVANLLLITPKELGGLVPYLIAISFQVSWVE